ncbi:MAG: hypothetical protein QM682_17435 [Paracoccus sp. (in: a-proteobacteria)]|uniref:hypothetical protein n=1 Tax=Paracoccus sp. TaxID=267 RepID=UPI0039E5EA26
MALPQLTVSSARHPAYAPQYVARALGLFPAAGVQVRLIDSPAGDSAITRCLRDGTADMVLGSLLFALRLAEEGVVPVVVGQSNQHTRHVLLSRTPVTGAEFDWARLRGAGVLVHPTNVPTPWAAFRQALTNKGLMLDDIRPIIGFSAQQAVPEFRRGVGDLMLADPEGLPQGHGLHELAPVAPALGPVPWSVYCAPAEAAARLAPALGSFRQALAHAVAWLYAHPSIEAAALLGPEFPAIPAQALAAQLERSARAGIWKADPAADAAQVARWAGALRQGGLMPPGRDLLDFYPELRRTA